MNQKLLIFDELSMSNLEEVISLCGIDNLDKIMANEWWLI